jgi:hypothetical protein
MRAIIKAAKKRYRSGPLRSLHLAATDLHEVGALDKATMRRFDVACLTPVAKPGTPPRPACARARGGSRGRSGGPGYG